ncbi:MAG: GNAT family N-acetyltransferase [Sandaracinaceae bacterium]|nr:GNAT family N-acetyltransferase [Sandaracinaceae bacterium]
MDEAILEAHVDLRLAALARHAAFAGGDRAREWVRGKIEPLHREGTVRVADDGGRIRGVIAWRHDPSPWYGAPVSSVAIDYDACDERWIEATLDEELPRMEADLDLVLDVAHTHAYRALRARGVGVGSVQLFGRPELALAKLGPASAVDLIPMQRAHVGGVIDLFRRTFEAEPQYCWFGANRGFLEHMQKEIERDLARTSHGQRVWLDGDRVVGHASATVRDDPLWGRTAGMSIAFAPELRGRGLLRGVYRHLLEAAVENGARTMKGGTSQPPVLRLAARMERPVYALVMRRAAAFPESHFAPYLPL